MAAHWSYNATIVIQKLCPSFRSVYEIERPMQSCVKVAPNSCQPLSAKLMILQAEIFGFFKKQHLLESKRIIIKII